MFAYLLYAAIQRSLNVFRGLSPFLSPAHSNDHLPFDLQLDVNNIKSVNLE